MIWLDVVWSLSMLGKQTESHLSSVLSPEFYNKLLCKYSYALSIHGVSCAYSCTMSCIVDSHDHKNVGIILKMLNLNAVAKHLVAGYSGKQVILFSPSIQYCSCSTCTWTMGNKPI